MFLNILTKIAIGSNDDQKLESLAAADKVSDNSQEAEKDYQRGLARLQAAEAGSFQDLGKIEAAYRYFAQAIQKNRHAAHYHSSMAHLQILLGDMELARNYIAAALRLNPAEPQALALQSFLQQLPQIDADTRRMASWSAFEQLPSPVSATDHVWLFQQVKEFLSKEIKAVLQSEVSTEISIDPKVVAEQERIFEQAVAIESMAEEKFAQLERELDIMELVALLQPLQQMRQSYGKALEGNLMFHILSDGLSSSRKQAQELGKQLSKGQAQDAKARLEQLMDDCDALADVLDTLGQNTKLQLLEHKYEQLVLEVGRLQDRFAA